jgi:hypothetical protein
VFIIPKRLRVYFRYNRKLLGKLCRAAHPNCLPFPLSGDSTLMAGIPRNFEVYDPLDFLAEVTQHIPNKGEHQIRYYGWYSNKKRGLQEKKNPNVEQIPGMPEPDTPFRRKCRMTPVVSLPNHGPRS